MIEDERHTINTVEFIEGMKELGLTEEQIKYVLEINEPVIDCRSYEGVTIGLIDSIITICRVLSTRDMLSHSQVKEALLDLAQDEDVRLVMELAKGAFDSAAATGLKE